MFSEKIQAIIPFMYAHELDGAVKLQIHEIEAAKPLNFPHFQTQFFPAVNATTLQPHTQNTVKTTCRQNIINNIKTQINSCVTFFQKAAKLDQNRVITIQLDLVASSDKELDIITSIFKKYLLIHATKIATTINNKKIYFVTFDWHRSNHKNIRYLLDQIPLNYETDYNQKRKANQFCDCLFTVQQQYFPAHKIILSKKSSYFNLMFTGKCKEANTTEAIHYGSRELTASLFGAILEFIYTGYIALKDKTLAELIILAKEARMLELKKLEWLCQHTLCFSLTPDTFVEIAAYAALLEKDSLLQVHCRYMIEAEPGLIDPIEQKVSHADIASLCDLYCIAYYYQLHSIKESIKNTLSKNVCKNTFKEYCDHGTRLPAGELRTIFSETCKRFATQNTNWLEQEERAAAKKSYESLLSCIH